MTYSLAFRKDAWKEWQALPTQLQAQLKKKLQERLENPKNPSAKLHGHPFRYKIKLRKAGYRLVYEVHDDTVTVVVIAIGKRERQEVYKAAAKRE